MRRVCVTADDYGMHPSVNAAIEELAATGRISAVAVMVHRDAVLDTLERLRATGVALGLHVVFTQERPLVDELASRDGGVLPDTPYRLLAAIARRPRLYRLLRDEVAAQADRYAALGLPLDFVNSHEHTHEVPPLWAIVCDLARTRRAPAVRSAHRQPVTLSQQGALALLSRASWLVRPLRSPTPQLLSPLGAGQAGRIDLATIEHLIARGLAWHASDGDAVLPELVMHPAIDDSPLRARYGPRTGDRRAELELLRSPELGALWTRLGVEIVPPRRAR